MAIYLYDRQTLQELLTIRNPLVYPNNRTENCIFHLLPPASDFLREVGFTLLQVFSAVYEIRREPIIVNNCTIDEAIESVILHLFQHQQITKQIRDILQMNSIPLAMHKLEHLIKLAVNHDMLIELIRLLYRANKLRTTSGLVYYTQLNRIHFADAIDFDLEFGGDKIYKAYTTWHFDKLLAFNNTQTIAYEHCSYDHITVVALPDGKVELRCHLEDNGTHKLYDYVTYDDYDDYLATTFASIAQDYMNQLLKSYGELVQLRAISVDANRPHHTQAHLAQNTYVFIDGNKYTAAFAVQTISQGKKITATCGLGEFYENFCSRIRYQFAEVLSRPTIEIVRQSLLEPINSSSSSYHQITYLHKVKFLEQLYHVLIVPDLEISRTYETCKYSSPLFKISIHPLFQAAVNLLQRRNSEVVEKLEHQLATNRELINNLQNSVNSVIDQLHRDISYLTHYANVKTFSQFADYISDNNSTLQSTIRQWLKDMKRYLLAEGLNRRGDELLIGSPLILLSDYLKYQISNTTVLSQPTKSTEEFLEQVKLLSKAAIAKIYLQLKSIAD